MRVRLAGVPAAYTTTNDVMVVDEEQNLYLIGRDDLVVTPLNYADAMLVAGFYEPVHALDWSDLDTFIRVVRIETRAGSPGEPSGIPAMNE